MRIAYIDAKVNNPPEDYSVNPKRYGGGAVVGRYGKQLLNNKRDEFCIFASKDCFDNLSAADDQTFCFPIDDWKLASLKAGAPIKDIIPFASQFDVFLHHHDCMTFNMTGLRAPLVHWALMGDGRANHQGTPYSLLYRHKDRAVHGKTLYVILGKPIPALKVGVREQFLFQCTRHDPHMNSIEVAKQCILHNIKCYFAGPIAAGYDLMNYIDNVNTFYLGSIDEKTKLDYLSRAAACPLLFNWDSPFNQSAIEALSMDTPLIINNRGFLSEIVKDGENGVIYKGNLENSLQAALSIPHGPCHASVEKYSEVNMIASFRAALDVVIADWGQRLNP